MTTSKRTLTIELPYPTGSGNHSVRHAKGGHYLTPEAKAYRVQVALELRRQGVGGHPGSAAVLEPPLRARWLLAPPDRRARDVDNVRKVVADALTQAGLIPDDSNRVLVAESFQWADPVPDGAIELTLEELA